MQAARAGGDLIQTALPQLVDILRLAAERTGHHHEVQLALGDRVVKELRRVGRVHIGDAAAGDADRLLDLLHDVQQQTAAGVVRHQLTLPMAAEIELRAVAGRTLDPVAGKIQLGCELTDVTAERSETQMQAVRTGGLEHLTDLAVFLHRGGQRAVAHLHIVLFDDVDQDLNNEVLAALFLDALDDLGHKARAVFKGLRAVFVIAIVAHAGEEGLADVVAGRVDLDRIEALLLDILGAGDEVLLQHMDLVQRQMLGMRRLILRGGSGIETAELLSHAGELIADVRTLGMQPVGQLLERNRLFGFLARILEIVIEFDKVLDPDHFDTAVGEVLIVGQELIRIVAGIGTGGGLHHAMAQFDLAELPGGEHMAQIGIFAAVIIVLRIQPCDCLLRTYDRRILRIGRGILSDQAGHSKSHGPGGRPFQKVTTRDFDGHFHSSS